MDFYDLDLNDYVLDALDDMNFTDTTPIQEHAIPPILEGRDVMGVAQTGTGKTAAYLLPVLSLLADGDYPKDAINCVIMSPTRELAQQIDSAMQGFAYYLNDISSVAVYGGNDGIRYEQEKRAMQSGADVVIATPGRLISHLSLGNIDLSRVSFFILDEADRMLDMGFCDDILLIAKALPKEHQTIMFSATMPGDILSLAHNILRNPVEVKLAVSKPADNIRQSAYICYEPQKLPIVKHILNTPSNFPLEEKKQNSTAEQDSGSPTQSQGNTNTGQEVFPSRGELEGSVIIFVGSKKKTKELAISIIRAGYNARAMHSDLTQAERDEVMHLFRSRKIDILVATDIVARGIDIDDIAIVINFDVPRDEEDYVHRIGRTARAGRGGRAVTLVNEKDMHSFRQIERFLGKEILKEKVPEELGETPSYFSSKGGKGKGKRRYFHHSKRGAKGKK
ncbi:MAG: DEAD/DEAH box helicase [Bacteroidaceae bacterium]|nr:DEAD/DEAH box helicase [Bacteroidaceae bacterium]